MLTLKIQQMTIDGHPYLCPECASEAFTLDGTGWIDAFPVRGNCWQSHSWEEPLITIGVLKEIRAASTGRQRPEDEDTFEIVIGGAVLAGILHPEATLDDLKQVATDVYWKRMIKPAMRRRKNRAKRALKRPFTKAAASAKQTATNTVATAKAAAIGAAWNLQASTGEINPDHQSEPVNPCPVCNDGYIQLDSNLHDTTRVRCSVCHGSGEID